MNILHILSTLNPKGGGPMEGVRQMGLYLTQQGHQIEVLSLDAASEPFIKEYPLPVHAIGPSSGSYAYNANLVPWLKAHVHGYDAVIINGIWQYHGFGAWRVLRHAKVPYFVFTHGMNDPWFKYQYPLKHLKKWLYWPWAEYRVLRDAAAVIFTCEEERLLSRDSFWLYKCTEAVTSYGTKTPPQDEHELREAFLSRYPYLRDKRIVLFLSRIHEKKGCDLLIKAFASVATGRPDLQLVMVGPDATGMTVGLQELAEAEGVADQVAWLGMLQGDLKWGAFYAAEIFALPSHQENFGIAVAEALGCGVPVFISNKVNIWREIEADGAGVVANDDLEGAFKLMHAWVGMSESERTAMKDQARRTFAQRYTVEAMGKRLMEIMKEFGVKK